MAGFVDYPKKKKSGKKQSHFVRDIDKESHEYFQRVLRDLENHDFQDEDDKEIFIENVFAQTEGQEIVASCNQLASRVLDQLIPSASFEAKLKFMHAFSDDLRMVAMDPFGGHVLQKLVLSTAFAVKGSSLSETDFQASFTWITKFCKFMVNNFDDFSIDLYASHLLRMAFQCAAGRREVDRKRKGQQNFENLQTVSLSQKSFLHTDDTEKNFLEILSAAVDKAMSVERLQDKCRHETFSGVIQSLLVNTSKASQIDCKRLSKFLYKNLSSIFDLTLPPPEFNQVEVSSIFREEAPCRIIEAVLEATSECSQNLFNKVSEKLFEGRLITLSQLPMTNFSVQKLLNFCKSKEKFDQWYESEFDEGLENILTSKNFGVLLCLAQACRRLNTKQSHFLNAIMRTLNCQEPSQYQALIVPLLVQLKKRESYNEKERTFNVQLHGSLILQELFNFSKPIKLVSSLLTLDSNKLRNLFSDPKGSHLVDVFMQSPSIGEKSRDSLVKSLQGQLVALACSKCGARAIDALWTHCSQRSKEIMAGELVTEEKHLNSNPFGKFISSKAALGVFKRSRENWKHIIDQNDKKRKAVNDFISVFKSPKTARVEISSKVPKIEKEIQPECFSIDTIGNSKLLEQDPIKEKKLEKKKKKKKAKSYLDDL